MTDTILWESNPVLRYNHNRWYPLIGFEFSVSWETDIAESRVRDPHERISHSQPPVTDPYTKSEDTEGVLLIRIDNKKIYE